MSRPQQFPLDASKFREEYLAILKQEIENDQLNLNANRLFEKTGQTNLGRPLDIRTATEKEQGTELNKVSLREILKKVTSLDSASQIVQQLSNDQVRFALNKWPIIEKEMKQTYALGVPSNVFIAYLNTLIEKYEDAIQVETGLQTTTNLLTNTQLGMDLAQPETIAQLRNALEATKYFNTAVLRGNLDDMVDLLMTPEDIEFYNTLPPEVRADTDVLRTEAYQEFPSNRQLLMALQGLREALAEEERETVRQALDELGNLLESVDSNRPVIQRMRSIIAKYKEREAPERPETLAQVLDDTEKEEQDYLFKMRADAIARRKAKVAEDERQAKRLVDLEQAMERGRKLKKSQAQERSLMGAEDDAEDRRRFAKFKANRLASEKEVEKDMKRATKLEAVNAVREQARKAEEKEFTTEALAKKLPKAKMPSMKAERQAMGAEDRPPLDVRQAEKSAPELSVEQFAGLLNKDKQAVLSDLVKKNPALTLTLRDSKGKEKERGLGSPQKATSFGGFTNAALNAAYREYKGKMPEEGRAEEIVEGGAIQWDKPNMSSRGKIMGHGIAHLIEKKVEKPKLYAPFGRYYIQKMKLDDQILQFKNPNGIQLNSLPTERVSSDLANVIHTFLSETPNYEEISKLNDRDKQKLAYICKHCHIMSPAVPKLKTFTAKEDDRFEVLRGQLIAGQDNLQLAKEFKLLMLKMVNEGRIPKRQANEILHEMLMLGL